MRKGRWRVRVAPPAACSGAMYPTEPNNSPARSSAGAAIPKSRRRTCPRESTITFRGVTSRWNEVELLVRIPKGVAHLNADMGNHFRSERPPFVEDLREGGAVDMLHREEVGAVDDPKLIDRRRCVGGSSEPASSLPRQTSKQTAGRSPARGRTCFTTRVFSNPPSPRSRAR